MKTEGKRGKTVKFMPSGIRLTVPENHSILDASRLAGTFIPSACGGVGKCGKCRVKILSGDLKGPSEKTREKLPEEMVKSGYVLACSEYDFSHVEVEIQSISLSPDITCKEGEKYGQFFMAVDLGSTTVGVSLVSASGERVCEGQFLNPQSAFGADVLSRVTAVERNSNNLREMEKLVKDSILQGVIKILKMGVTGKIRRMAVAGNSIMSYIFNGISPVELTKYPFPLKHRTFPPSLLKINSQAIEVVTVPLIGPFVGGDITAGLISTGFMDKDGVILYIDLGTNAEMVLKKGNEVVATSAPAGPAFEGTNITHGMPAVKGAINEVQKSGMHLKLNVIGGGNIPEGICGSGLFSLIHLLYKEGVIDRTGLIREPENVPGDLGNRVIIEEDERAFLVFWGAQGKIVLRQRDVRAFQMAKGAVRAGTFILLTLKGLKPEDIDEVIVAGAMGLHINPQALIDLNVIPPVSLEKIKFVGNASLKGAELIAVNDALNLAEKTASSIEHIELSTVEEFKQIFPKMMYFGG